MSGEGMQGLQVALPDPPGGSGGPPRGVDWPMVRTLVMNWCFTIMADYLWVPVAAYADDRGFDGKFVGLAYSLNLGIRFCPNLLVVFYGIQSEYIMMATVFAGCALSLLFPGTLWGFFALVACSGAGFVRAHISLHLQASFGFEPERLARANKWSGAMRNLGTITGFAIPSQLYRHFGWDSICMTGMAASALYASLSVWEVRDRNRRYAGMVRKVGVGEGTDGEAAVEGATDSLHWALGVGFCSTEFLFNVGIAAIPQTLTKTLGMEMHKVGPLMAAFNGMSAVFLAVLPGIPWRLLQEGPNNVTFSFLLNVFSWGAAAVGCYLADYPNLFFCSALLSMVVVNLAEILAVEFLAGDLDAKGLKQVMGWCETVSCAFDMAGAYIGSHLQILSPGAPYVLQSGVSLATMFILAVFIKRRQRSARGLMKGGCAAIA